jgi:predicted enzyme related to lactoylglutathione lyase
MFFALGGVRRLLEAEAPLAVIYFGVDDIQASYLVLQEKGIQFEDEPHLIHTDEEGVFDNPGTSEWMVFFKDPAGNTLALASRTAPEG